MPGIVILAFFQMTLINWTPCNSATLPKWVHRVDSCPDPTDNSQWMQASKSLNCIHNLSSTELEKQQSVYQCMPSSFLNETVEFCGRSVTIDAGHCPIYNYRYGPNIQPTYYNCSSFASGCPNTTFLSKEVFKYPACLRIISNSRCYEAQKNCLYMNNYTSTAYPLTKDEGTTMETHITSTSNRIANAESANSNVWKIIAIIALIAIICITVACAVIFLIHKRKGFRNQNKKKEITEEDENLTNQNEGSDIQETALGDRHSDTNLPNGYNQNRDIEETSPKDLLISNSSPNGQIRKSERETYLDNWNEEADKMKENVFIEMLKKDMSTEIVNRIKAVLKDRPENNRNELDSIKNAEELLKYLFKKYLALHNIVVLQGIFLMSKAPKLYDRCIEFGKKRGRGFTFFEKKITNTDHKRTTYVLNCPDSWSYSERELNKLKQLVVKITNAQFDDILVNGVKTGCVIVTFMIRNCLIPTLRALYTPEKLAYQWMLKLPLKHKIMKVVIEDEVIYMSDISASVDKLTAEAKICGHVQQSRLKSYQTITKIKHTKECFKTDHAIVKCEDDSEISNEESDVNKESVMIEKRVDDTQELKDFLESTGGCITDDTLNSMKAILQEFMDENSVKIMDTTTMLSEMLELFKLQFNFSFLEWIFEKCGEYDLVEKCKQFSFEKHFQLECFRTKIIPRPGDQHVEFHLMVFELESFQAEIHTMRQWLAETICVHPGQIFMTALQNRPIVVTFMMNERLTESFLKFLQTDDGQIAASRRRVEKVVINKRVIKIEQALSGSNFIHVRLRFQRNLFGRLGKSVRNVTSTVLRRTGLSMEGREILIRTIPSNTKKHEDRGDSNFETFLRINQNSLLENFEPVSMLEKSGIVSLFSTEEKIKMKEIEGRKKRAMFFLDMCRKLSEEEKDLIVTHLKDILPSSKELPCPVELDDLKRWIHKNRETLLDEIDTDFIETTIGHMEDVPYEVYTLCRDPRKGRKEKADIFLEFALKKDDYVLALQTTLKENDIFINE